MNLLCGKAWLKSCTSGPYEMDDCGDGETALELLAAERYDLVLLDLNLPKVNGMTVPSGANGARVVVSRSQDGSTVVCENALENARG